MKYEIGQEVFYLKNNRVHSAKVISRKQVDSTHEPKDNMDDNAPFGKTRKSYHTCHGIFDENNVFPSKDALCRALFGGIKLDIELPPKKDVFILLYSEKADQQYGHNVVLANSGERVKYTCMHKRELNFHWWDYYNWDDTTEVGYAESGSQIVEFDNRTFCNCPLCRMRINNRCVE